MPEDKFNLCKLLVIGVILNYPCQYHHSLFAAHAIPVDWLPIVVLYFNKLSTAFTLGYQKPCKPFS